MEKAVLLQLQHLLHSFQYHKFILNETPSLPGTRGEGSGNRGQPLTRHTEAFGGCLVSFIPIQKKENSMR